MRYQNFEDDYLLDFSFLSEPLEFGDFKLHQVGKKFCKPSADVFSHTHINWFELTAIIEGEGEVYANGKKTQVCAGDIFMSFPCDIHKIVSSHKAPLKYTFLSFSLENDVYKQEFSQIIQNFYECEKRLFKNNNVSFLIDMLIAEISANEFQKDKIILDALNQIVVYTIRGFLHNSAKTVSLHASKNELLCYKVMRYIDNNVFTIQSLTEITEQFHYNYTYLAKVFMQTTNLTLKQYLSKRKLERAKVLIKEGKLSLTEIANLLNYASIYSFSKSFKFHFGIPPAEYKRIENRKV